MHETILQNFDANYAGDFAHDIDFIISTEVLAEGINLHRANMLINYDTPWNATKLMQRIWKDKTVLVVLMLFITMHFIQVGKVMI